MDQNSKMDTKSNLENIFSDRLMQFFEQEKFTDCTFNIQGKDLKAHKLILACASPVFEGMFFGQMASDTIFLHDLTYENFHQTLVYVYSKDIEIQSVENAWDLYYIAQKYLLDHLSKICYDYISKNKRMSSLILSYEYAELYNQKELKNDCLFDMSCAINATFFSGYHMKPSTLAALLKVRSGFVIKQDLVARIIEWAIEESEIQGVECPTTDQILQLLKSTDILRFIYKSWILTNTCAYCAQPVKTCTCLNETVGGVVSKLAENELIWKEHPHMDHSLWRFPSGIQTRTAYKIARRLDLSKSEEFVSYVSVDKACVNSVLVVNTETKPDDSLSEEYDGSITIRFCLDGSNQNLVEPTKIMMRFVYNTAVYIPLRYPVTMYPERYYDIKISYENRSSKRSKSILVCTYMSGNVEDKSRENNARMYFYDDGSVIKGVGYYPL